MTRTSTCIFALLGVLATSTAINAAGQFGQTQRSMTVSYSDLNISHQEGAEILLSRIRFAANKVCGGNPDQRDLSAESYNRACDKQAMDGAIAAIDSPLVARLYENPGRDTEIAELNELPDPNTEVARLDAQLHENVGRNIDEEFSRIDFN